MPAAPSFPAVSGTSLSGHPYAFPQDFSAPWTLAVVTFRDELDPLADQWALAAERIAAGSEGRLVTFELPVVGRRFGPFRGIVNATIARRAETETERKRTIPLYVNRDQFRKRLGLKGEDVVHVLLVEQGGAIVWRGGGALTPVAIAAVEDAVGEMMRV